MSVSAFESVFLPTDIYLSRVLGDGGGSWKCRSDTLASPGVQLSTGIQEKQVVDTTD